ncbi:unnamed protein product [Periconia digitata]|uniref:Rhodopsin domain-containing protein n=1 Tax=Periconia digitata TaxID=1303443 RepID=A0A9W4XRU0_9PLEO|nr:unnamed protein product [Periconia digitata]
MIKLSVLSLYHRILRGVSSPALRTTVWAMFALVAANTTANVLVCIFQCRPIEAAWKPLADTHKANKVVCVNINSFYLGNAITGVITDALVYLLCIPIVKPLQMDAKTKLQLLVILLIGAFAVVTSAVRLGFIPALLKDPDLTMAMSIPMSWSVAEPAVGLLVSSMPATRAIRFLWRKEGNTSYGSGTAQSTLRGRNGQIQLVDMSHDARADGESAKSLKREPYNRRMDGSVEGLARMGTISRTTELEVCISSRNDELP